MTLPLVCGAVGPGAAVTVSSKTAPGARCGSGVTGFLADKHCACSFYRSSEASGLIGGGWHPLSLLLTEGEIEAQDIEC